MSMATLEFNRKMKRYAVKYANSVQETKSRSSLEFTQKRLTKVLCLMPEFLIFQRKK